MAFCPICKGQHDPDLQCTDMSTQILREAGIEPAQKTSKQEQREIENQADRSMIVFFLVLISIVVACIIYSLL